MMVSASSSLSLFLFPSLSLPPLFSLSLSHCVSLLPCVFLLVRVFIFSWSPSHAPPLCPPAPPPVVAPTLTVRETFRFYAGLKMPAGTTDEQREERVSEVIRLLQLEKAADTLVGDELIRGISGGEKRRVTIGVELLINPSCVASSLALFLLSSFFSPLFCEGAVSWVALSLSLSVCVCWCVCACAPTYPVRTRMQP